MVGGCAPDVGKTAVAFVEEENREMPAVLVAGAAESACVAGGRQWTG